MFAKQTNLYVDAYTLSRKVSANLKAIFTSFEQGLLKGSTHHIIQI